MMAEHNELIELDNSPKGPFPYISTASADMTAAEAYADAASVAAEDLYTLVFTPDFCGFVRPSEGGFRRLSDEDDGGQLTDSIFEMRCFCSTFEMRWNLTDGCAGSVVFISDGSLSLGDRYTSEILGKDSKSEDKKDSDNTDDAKSAKGEDSGRMFSLDGEYLLWGQGMSGGDNAACLFEHRIGRLSVPISLGSRSRVMLCSREYFDVYSYGSLRWLAERLRGLRVQ